MKDHLVRVIASNANIRGLACVSTGLVREACQRHGTSPTASAALGRAMTGGALMGALLKRGQRVALRFEGDGAIKKILVEADWEGGVKGYVGVPGADVPPRNGKLDVAGVLGRKGLLVVTKDLRLKEPYSGMVELSTGEIGEDLAYYLTESEQIPSAVGLGVFVGIDGTVSAAGGFLIQSFPPYTPGIVDRLVEKIGTIPSITEMLRSGKTPEDMLAMIFEGIPFDILQMQDLSFRCTCSKERVEQALIILGREEVSALLEKYGDTDVKCEYCHETYHLTEEDLQRLLREMGVGETFH